MNLGLRFTDTSDEPFLYAVYCSTREEELSFVSWDAEQKEMFLQMQYKAQCQGYRTQFQSADWQIILFNNLPIGRLIINQKLEEVRVVDIAFLPQYRSQGIGTFLIKKIMNNAKNVPVRLHVSIANIRAFLLYERLGFVVIGKTETHFSMEWVSLVSRN